MLSTITAIMRAEPRVLYSKSAPYIMMTSSNGNIFRVPGHLCWGALMFSLICVWINGSVNNREAGYLRCHRAHYDVIVMFSPRGQVMCVYHEHFWQIACITRLQLNGLWQYKDVISTGLVFLFKLIFPWTKWLTYSNAFSWMKSFLFLIPQKVGS